MATTALVGTVLSTAETPLVGHYARRLGTQEALSDQRTAAALMWTTGVALALPLLVLTVWRWASTEQRRAERAEALLDVPPHLPSDVEPDAPAAEPVRKR